ncbi:MAG: tetratricopeptide repeat protein [Saprospiraceae bacterium]|nr:tetratricopeptide repeat protein [Saprospiraceae bacterium]
MKKTLLALLFIMPLLLAAQPDPRLAEQYFQTGELEKAATLYEKLYAQNSGDYYFERYLSCLMDLSRFDEAERIITKQIKKEPSKSTLYVQLGKLYERQNKTAAANEQFKKAIDKLTSDRYVIDNLASTFSAMARYDLALSTYEQGGKLMRNKNLFAYNLAELYRRKDDVPMMIESYLNAIKENPGYLPSVQSMLMRNASGADEQAELQSQLYARIQDEPKILAYPELLSWLFLQKKDYKNAFRQLKAVDRMNGEDGNRVYGLANIAAEDHDYDAAIEGYNYIVSEKGRQSPLFIISKQSLLSCKRKKLTEGYTFTKEELIQIEKEYESFLDEIGRNARTAPIVSELAELEAFYLQNLDKAVALLEEVIEFPMVDKEVQSKAKLSLGDFYLIRGERWEATLLYSQVDKLYKDDILGHEARFKNAKLSYYFGDFDWAKAQFDVLKASTSKLISNDAIDMSVFILDNTGLDSVTTAMEMYAQAELLVFQNKYVEAFEKLDSITMLFPEHSLDDDVLYLKAKVFKKQREYTKAVALYEKIVEKYKEEIRADNALFEMAEIYETRLNDKEKAKSLYEKLFTDFSDSTLAVEARKRFRILRGDKLGKEQ